MSYCGYPVRGSQETKFQVGDEVKILFGRYTGQIGKITGYLPSSAFPYCVQIHTHPKSQVESGEYSPDELKLYTIYSPAHHKDGVVRAIKAEAEADSPEFDGITTE